MNSKSFRLALASLGDDLVTEAQNAETLWPHLPSYLAFCELHAEQLESPARLAIEHELSPRVANVLREVTAVFKLLTTGQDRLAFEFCCPCGAHYDVGDEQREGVIDRWLKQFFHAVATKGEQAPRLLEAPSATPTAVLSSVRTDGALTQWGVQWSKATFAAGGGVEEDDLLEALFQLCEDGGSQTGDAEPLIKIAHVPEDYDEASRAVRGSVDVFVCVDGSIVFEPSYGRLRRWANEVSAILVGDGDLEACKPSDIRNASATWARDFAARCERSCAKRGE